MRTYIAILSYASSAGLTQTTPQLISKAFGNQTYKKALEINLPLYLLLF